MDLIDKINDGLLVFVVINMLYSSTYNCLVSMLPEVGCCKRTGKKKGGLEVLCVSFLNTEAVAASQEYLSLTASFLDWLDIIK